MSSLINRERVLGFFAIAGLAVGLYYAFLLVPLQEQAAELRRSLQAAEGDLAAARREIAALGPAHEKQARVEAKRQSVVVPGRRSGEVFVYHLAALESRLGLKVAVVQGKDDRTTSGLVETPYGLEVEAPYQALQQFIYALERLPLLTVTEALELRSVAGQGESTSFLKGRKLTARIQMKTYFDPGRDGPHHATT